MKKHDETFKELSEKIAFCLNPLQVITKSLTNHMSPLHKALNLIAKRMQEIPGETKEIMLLMANEQWYLDPEIPVADFPLLIKNFKTNKSKTIDFFINYYRSKIDEIEKYIVANFPEREAIFIQAFSAHRERKYFLSVPVFLTQADGIAKDKTGYELFLKTNGKPKTSKYVKQYANKSFIHTILTPLNEDLPISFSTGRRNKSFDGLNRHQILHGESKNYGSETNSLKAISLIYFLTKVFKIIKNP